MMVLCVIMCFVDASFLFHYTNNVVENIIIFFFVFTVLTFVSLSYFKGYPVYHLTKLHRWMKLKNIKGK